MHCSKNEVQWLLRKLIGMHVLREDTYRQDNQYGNVVACLKVNRREAESFLASSQHINMPYLVSAKQAAVTAAKKAGMPGLHVAVINLLVWLTHIGIASKARGVGAATRVMIYPMKQLLLSLIPSGPGCAMQA